MKYLQYIIHIRSCHLYKECLQKKPTLLKTAGLLIMLGEVLRPTTSSCLLSGSCTRATEKPVWEPWVTAPWFLCDWNNYQALGLIDYDDILPSSDIHSLIALVSALHQAFSQCSKVTISSYYIITSLSSSGICCAGISWEHQWWKTYTAEWPGFRDIH